MRAIATTKKSIDDAAKHKDVGKKRAYLSTGMPLLQRQCACGGGCPRCKEELGIQTKLKISEPGDKYEQEADRIADMVMRMPKSSIGIQSNEDYKTSIYRKAIAPPTALSQAESSLSSAVYKTIGSLGQSLDTYTQAFMESRLGHDFTQVRLHVDARAAQSADALNARAYTVGQNIIFGQGQYAPRTYAGLKLLAHELVHVVQQQPSKYGQETTRSESNSNFTIRQKRSNSESNHYLSAKNWAGEQLPQEQRQGLAEFLFEDVGVTPGNISGTVQGPRFLLHDTSGASSRSTIEANARNARGPRGSGPHVFVPATGLEIIQRPDFFDSRRPTTTDFEKGTDILDQAARETAFRQVWAATRASERTRALDRALGGIRLSPQEIAAERSDATQQLNATSGMIFSTATWAISEICAQASRTSAADVAASGHERDLSTACAAIQPLLQARSQRLGSTVSVELVQVGHRSRGGQGNPNTCDITNPDILPLPNPPYSDTQYQNTMLMYLRATVMAGRYPEITTHFVVDAFVGGHCDPRCFNLNQLYSTISGTLAPLGHASGDIYGITPRYGTSSGRDSVWWNNRICHGTHP